MITFTGPDNTVSYPPGATVAFKGTLGPPTGCRLVLPAAAAKAIPVPAGLGANWSFDVVLPTTAGTYTYAVDAPGSKGDTRTITAAAPPVATPPVVGPGATDET